MAAAHPNRLASLEPAVKRRPKGEAQPGDSAPFASWYRPVLLDVFGDGALYIECPTLFNVVKNAVETLI